MFSPVGAHVDLNKWCFVIVLVWEATKHDPNPDHCSKIFREIVKFERNAMYRQYQGYIAASKVNRVPYSASLNRENFAITVWRISVQPPFTISRISLILQGLGLSANLLLEKIVSYTVLKNG